MAMHKAFLRLAAWLSGILFLSVSVTAQTTEQPASTLTREQMIKSAKVYFRDTTEFPMRQNMTFTVTDSSGRVRQVKHQASDYLFNGYNPGNKRASGRVRGKESFWAAMRGSKMLKASLNSVLWSWMAGFWVYADPADYTFEAQEPRDGLMLAKLTPVKPCPPLTMEKKADFYFPDDVCGPGEFELHSDLSFQKFLFDAPGLPLPIKVAPLGRSTLQRYHAEVEFQEILLSGDKEPFLVPKKVTATLETNKGNVVITSVYEAKQAN